MQTHILGYPRIGSRRELKKACEQYWAGKITLDELQQTGSQIRKTNWQLQAEAAIDLPAANDFSYYDQVLDLALSVHAIPARYKPLLEDREQNLLDLYFAMARGYQKEGFDLTAMEMTKWFNTNYHYIVPEFTRDQQFKLFSTKIIDEFKEAKAAGFDTKPVLIGPISFLLLGKEKECGFHCLELLDRLLPVYLEILEQLQEAGAHWVQFDEPFLTMDLTEAQQQLFTKTYTQIKEAFPELKTLLATYFEGLGDNLETAINLPVCSLHLDLVTAPEQLQPVLDKIPKNLSLSLGIIDGRNIWKNNYKKSLKLIKSAVNQLGEERVMLATSCSLLHTPCDLDLEKDEQSLPRAVKNWLAFARQKLDELSDLKDLSSGDPAKAVDAMQRLDANTTAIEARSSSLQIHNDNVKERIARLNTQSAERKSAFSVRKEKQRKLNLPPFPTTTIGSFPQTGEVRKQRARYKKGNLSASDYEQFLKEETEKAIRRQEQLGLDVLVHGEFERNDMVEYFGERLAGFAFTKFGWVQSYGSRCVKPPIIYGDVHRPEAMTVAWSSYAQRLTKKHVKGMLTGPITILHWSFVRDDQPQQQTCNQIALAIRDEVVDLEKAGIRIIQIDEPALREGLPLRKTDWQTYLNWAINAFKIASSGVADATQIHTHMCYSEFNDIIAHIAAMDADVITIECSRSQMELLDAFAAFNYPNDIGPGVYDIHSPRIPDQEEIVQLLEKAKKVIPEDQLWVNPDCGLKTRGWEETEKALQAMVSAAGQLRKMNAL